MAVVVLAVKILVLIVLVLLSAAYVLLAERRLLGRFQMRIGPNRCGPFGLIQPLADAAKLMGKEFLVPDGADRVLFRMAPVLAMVSAFGVYAFIPLGPGLMISDVNTALLMVMAVSSMGVYAIVLGGTSSNNSFAAIGALRSASQMISYEVSLVLGAMGAVTAASSLSLREIVDYQSELPLVVREPATILSMLVFFIAAMAETNRTPFDLPEAESELVGGYHTEYTGMGFGLFFLGEYTNVITVCLLTSLLFLGGWHGPGPDGIWWLLAKAIPLIFVFIWARATMLRFRQNLLMSFGWKFLLPLSALALVLEGAWKVLR
jgi:NADH-quinone oxidoreductase subunit H